MKYSLKSIETELFNLKKGSLTNKEYNVLPSLGKNIQQRDENTYELRLSFSMKNEENNILPLEIELIIKGVFMVENYSEEELNLFLNTNAIQILFPYLRGILSTTMSALMIQPIYLPLMDVRDIFSKE